MAGACGGNPSDSSPPPAETGPPAGGYRELLSFQMWAPLIQYDCRESLTDSVPSPETRDKFPVFVELMLRGQTRTSRQAGRKPMGLRDGNRGSFFWQSCPESSYTLPSWKGRGYSLELCQPKGKRLTLVPKTDSLCLHTSRTAHCFLRWLGLGGNAGHTPHLPNWSTLEGAAPAEVG